MVCIRNVSCSKFRGLKMALLGADDALSDDDDPVPPEPLLGDEVAIEGFGQGLLREDEELNEAQANRDTESFCKWLVRRWCCGKLSAEELARGARTRAGQPGQEDEGSMIGRLGRLNEHNAHRDLTRLLITKRGIRRPPLFFAMIPMWCLITQTSKLVRVPFLLPHEWMESIVEDVGVGPLLDMSREMREQVEAWRARANIPHDGAPISGLSVWGDTAPYHTGKDSIMLLCWKADSMTRRIWITAFSKESVCQCGRCDGMHTLDAVWRVVAWSLQHLASGTWPSVGPFGEPLDPWRKAKQGKN